MFGSLKKKKMETVSLMLTAPQRCDANPLVDEEEDSEGAGGGGGGGGGGIKIASVEVFCCVFFYRMQSFSDNAATVILFSFFPQSSRCCNAVLSKYFVPHLSG
jgi:hypothetical protein